MKEFFFKRPHKTTVIVDDEGLIIKRKGALSFATQGIKGEKKIYFKNITALEFRKPTALITGYIQLSILGSVESRNGIKGTAQDENSILFWKSDALEGEELKKIIENNINKKEKENDSISNLDELKKLKELLDLGAITPDEFETKKKELLDI